MKSKAVKTEQGSAGGTRQCRRNKAVQAEQGSAGGTRQCRRNKAVPDVTSQCQEKHGRTREASGKIIMNEKVSWRKLNRRIAPVEALLRAFYIGVMLMLTFFSAEKILSGAFFGFRLFEEERDYAWKSLVLIALSFTAFYYVGNRLGKSRSVTMTGVFFCAVSVILVKKTLESVEILDRGLNYLEIVIMKDLTAEDYKGYIKGHMNILHDASYTIYLIGICAVFLLFFLSFVFNRYIIMFLLPAGAVGLSLAMGMTPDHKGFIYMIFMLFSVTVTGREMDRRSLSPLENGPDHSVKILINHALTVFVIILLLLGAKSLSRKPEELMHKYTEKFQEMQSEFEDYLKGVGRGKDKEEDQRIDNREPKYKNKEVLTVITDKQPLGDIYIKDFSAADYNDAVWDNRNDTFENDLQNYMSIRASRIYLTGGIYRFLKRSHSELLTEYKVEYKSEGTAAVVPYYYDIKMLDILKFDKEDSTSKPSGVMDYSFTAGNVSMLSKSTQEEYLAFQKDMSQVERDFYLWYNDYASMHYMDVPKEIKESALKILKEDSVINSMIEADRYFVENYDQMQREDWYQVIGLLSIEKANAVRNLLTTSYAYSTKLDRIGDKVDPVMYFLNESKEGYCAHFASAGVMMLRSLGVPARYASGYVVRDSRFKRNASGKYAAPVLDSYAHSWVEIYVENYGWIPFDMTPGEGGFSNAPSGGGNEIVTENTSDTVNEITENTTEKVTASTETSETSTDEINVTEAATEDTDAPGKTVKKPDKTAVVILVIVITLVAAASTALIILYLKLRKKRLINDAMTKIAEGTDIEENILLLDHMLLKLMRNILSMRRGRMTDEEYLKNLKKAFPSFSAEEWEKYVEILQKIHYSKQKLAFGGKEAGEVCIKIFKGTVCK